MVALGVVLDVIVAEVKNNSLKFLDAEAMHHDLSTHVIVSKHIVANAKCLMIVVVIEWMNELDGIGASHGNTVDIANNVVHRLDLCHRFRMLCFVLLRLL